MCSFGAWPNLVCLFSGLLRGAQRGEFSSSISKNCLIFLSPPASSGMAEVAHTEVPKLYGPAGSFANYEETLTLRKCNSAMDPAKKAARLLLHMLDVARKVCLSIGRDVIGQ